jgi:hypothetical protein
MPKQRGYPDRRGMGAQSDFIGETFVPSEEYKAQQTAMIQKLAAAGLNPQQLEKLFLVSAEPALDQEPRAEKVEDGHRRSPLVVAPAINRTID